MFAIIAELLGLSSTWANLVSDIQNNKGKLQHDRILLARFEMIDDCDRVMTEAYCDDKTSQILEGKRKEMRFESQTFPMLRINTVFCDE
jgi:hypothetical protein